MRKDCMLVDCPECHKKLHEGQHRYADGVFQVFYCKSCGFRKEVPMTEAEKHHNTEESQREREF